LICGKRIAVGVPVPGAAGDTVHPGMGIRQTSPRLAVLKLLQLEIQVIRN